MSTRVLVLVGTKKGGFILESDRDRRDWVLRGPFCQAWPLNHLNYDAATGAIYAGGENEWYGPGVWRTPDLGETWTQSGDGLTYGADGPKVKRVWNVTPARTNGHSTVYAGVEPAGLFRSDDDGATWSHVAGLRAHPTTPNWFPGGGGLCLHSIVPHPTDPRQMWIAISAVGTFYTADGGATWETRNRGVRADFIPEKDPEWGQCVHKIALHPSRPDRLYQQNHCGVYRSGDQGMTWQEISAGLPSDFGFPIAVHPYDPDTIYVIPLVGQGRFMPDGQAAVWRSRDAGTTWARLSKGLPQENAYLGVLREAMATDPLDSAGIYFGTGNGQVFASRDEGESWTTIADFLPPVCSVETAIIQD